MPTVGKRGWGETLSVFSPYTVAEWVRAVGRRRHLAQLFALNLPLTSLQSSTGTLSNDDGDTKNDAQ